MMRRIGKRAVLCALLCLCAALFGGCGRVGLPESVSVPSLAVSEDGEVTAWLVGDFARDYYRLEELEAMVKEEIDAFNRERAAQGYTAEAESVERTEDGQKAVVKLHFNGTDAYEAYTGGVLFYGSVTEAQLAGFGLEVELTDADGKNTIDKEGILALTDRHLLITGEKARIYAPYKPQYVSEREALSDDGSVNAVSAEGYTYIITK